MTSKRIIPSFATEAEEAQWRFDNSDELDKDFEQAAADGTLGRGRLAPVQSYLEPRHHRVGAQLCSALVGEVSVFLTMRFICKV